MAAAVYSRPVTAIERFNLVINAVYRYNLDAVVEGRGDLTLDQLREAVAAAAQANPGVRVRYRGALAWSRWRDSGIAPAVRSVTAPQWNGYDERGVTVFDSAFDVVGGGPVCEVLWMPGEPSRVIFRAVHGAMDGRGLDHFIKEVFRSLRGEPLQGGADTTTDADVRKKYRDQVRAEPPAVDRCVGVLAPAATGRDPLRYCWRRVRLDKAVKYLMPKLAVFLAQQANTADDEDIIFTITVDYRSLREPIASVGNLTGYLKIPVTATDSARSVMKKINAAVRDYADCYTPGEYRWLPWLSIGYMAGQLRKNIDKLLYENGTGLNSGGIVSFGHTELSDYSCPAFAATSFFALPGSVGKLNILIFEFSDHAEVIFSAPAPYNAQGQLDGLIEQFRQSVQA